jgi:hypothetical protein
MSALAGTITAPFAVRQSGMGMAWWLRSILSLLAAATILAVAIPVAFGSSGPSTGANPVQVFSSGPLIAAESSGGGRLSIDGMIPGQSRSATIRVSNAGSAPAAFSLAADLADRVGPGGAPLSRAMTLRVLPVGGGVPLYAGSLAQMPRLALGRIVPGDARAFRFTVALPSSVGNEVGGSSLRARFIWNAA